MGNSQSVGEYFQREWTKLLIFLIGFTFDTLVGCAIFGAFVLFSWIIGQTSRSGITSEGHLQAFEQTHFWLNYGVFLTVGFGQYV
jgi:hypothetical protein